MSPGQQTCSSCGTPNLQNAIVCSNCGARMRLVSAPRADRQRELEIVLEGVAADEVQKIKSLHQELTEKPESLALHMQLAQHYKDAGIKDRAIEHFEAADKLSPGNVLIKERLRRLKGLPPLRPEPSGSDDDSQSADGRSLPWLKIIGVLILLLVAAAALKVFVFPSTVRVAGYAKFDAINPRFSPDGKYVAFVKTPKFTLFGAFDQLRDAVQHRAPAQDSTLIVKKFPGGEEIELAQFTAWEVWDLGYCWLPGKEELVYQASGEDGKPVLYRVELRRHKTTMIAQGHSPAASPDGSYLAYIAMSRGSSNVYNWGPELLHVMRLQEEGQPTVKTVSGIVASNPVWSPNENLLAFQGRPTTRARSFTTEDLGRVVSDDIYTYRPGVGALKLTNDGLSTRPFFTPDGLRIAFHQHSSSDEVGNVLMIVDAIGGLAQPMLAPADNYEGFGEAAFSPHSKQLAFEGIFINPNKPVSNSMVTPLGVFGGEANYVTDLFLVNLDGSDLRRLESSRHPYKTDPMFHPTRNWLVYQVQYVDLHKEIWATKVN
ncbi:MAG: hypothetical protein P9M14_01580 [Candidatus Alcyoniella australis]|nr:hypothetical protein [Candidatus Alcyoniella australis]